MRVKKERKSKEVVEATKTTPDTTDKDLMEAVEVVEEDKEAQEKTDITEIVEVSPEQEVAPEPEIIEVADCDTWRYHETEQPRMFKSGQQIPAGWTRENRKFWRVNANGVMERVNG